MIKIVVSSACCFAGTDFSKYEELINQAISEGHTPGVISYLHGELESAMHYDIGCVLNGEECIEGDLYIPGKYSAEVIGYPNKCVAFLWNSNNRPRGLVVDTNDIEGYNHALKCFKIKRENL